MTKLDHSFKTRILMAALAMAPLTAVGQPSAPPAIPPAASPSEPEVAPALKRATLMLDLLATSFRNHTLRLFWETRDDRDDYFVDRMKGKADPGEMLAFRKELLAWGRQVVSVAGKGTAATSDETMIDLQFKSDLLQRQLEKLLPEIDRSAFSQTQLSTDHQFEALVMAVRAVDENPRECTTALRSLVINGLAGGIDNYLRFGRNVSMALTNIEDQQRKDMSSFNARRPSVAALRTIKL